MQLDEALRKRQSIRAFSDRPVARETLEAILELARHAPSGANTQPWQVAVLDGESKRRLTNEMEQAFRDGQPARPDYHYYPEEWHSPYRERRRICGQQLYSALAIERGDRQRQQDQWAANYRAFDAPVMLLFFMDGIMGRGSFLDYGMFLQSLMLAATSLGLASCPQAALGEYPDIAKRLLGYPSDSILLGGMALGYAEAQAAINGYRTEREPVATFTRFFLDEDGKAT